jgi:hypothetical protein
LEEKFQKNSKSVIPTKKHPFGTPEGRGKIWGYHGGTGPPAPDNRLEEKRIRRKGA